MTRPPAVEVLAWYLEAGVDEAIAATPQDRFSRPAAAPAPAAAPPEVPARTLAAARPSAGAPAPAAARIPAPPVGAETEAVRSAYTLAQAAATLAELRQALESFEGCGLKKTATNLVFCDGDATTRIVFVGEAPGAEEDRMGLPFVGPSGHLLERMLASIGLKRTDVLITNTVFWRPPGNRAPSTAEVAACQPFVERLIEIVDPEFLVALGGAAAKSLLGLGESVGRLRGRWHSFATPRLPRPIQATVTFHPAYLLRSPAQKREAWRDLLGIRHALEKK